MNYDNNSRLLSAMQKSNFQPGDYNVGSENLDYQSVRPNESLNQTTMKNTESIPVYPTTSSTSYNSNNLIPSVTRPSSSNIRSISPGRTNTTSNIRSSMRNYGDVKLPTQNSNFSDISDINLDNIFSKLHLTVISVFNINDPKGHDQKFILVRNILGNKFIVKVSDTDHFITVDKGEVYQYHHYTGSILPSYGNLDLPPVEDVFYTCGSDGLCIMENGETNPNRLNFASVKNVGKEMIYTDGAVLGYPLVSLEELKRYNEENHTDLMKKVALQSCKIRKLFSEAYYLSLVELKTKMEETYGSFNNIRTILNKTYNQYVVRCNENNNICQERLRNTDYKRLNTIISQAKVLGEEYPNQQFKECNENNNEVEELFSIIRSLTLELELASQLSANLKNIESRLEKFK